MCNSTENASALTETEAASFGGEPEPEPEPLSELLNELALYFMTNTLEFTILALIAVALIAFVASVAWHTPKAVVHYRGDN